MRLEPGSLFDLDGTWWTVSINMSLPGRKRSTPRQSVWRIHGRIGMSGGPFSNQLLRETGLEISSERVERLRQAHAAAYRRKADGVGCRHGKSHRS